MKINKIHNVWGGGQLLAFSGIDGKTDFKNGIILRTAMQGYIFEFKQRGQFNADSIISYHGAELDDLELSGDFFRFYTGDKISCGVIADSHNILLDGDFSVKISSDYEMLSEGTKILVASNGFLKSEYLYANMDEMIEKRKAFVCNAVFPDHLSVDSQRAAVKALSQLKTQIYSPEGQIKHYWSTPDRWPHKNMWLWDSVFHAIGMRHFDLDLAKEMIDAMFDLQQPDGLIPHSGTPDSVHMLTQPPVLALAVKILNSMRPDEQWISAIAPKLERYIEWIMANRDTDGAGLVEWKIEEYEDCRSGESGMDNSPRFDSAMQLDAPDFNSFLAFECEALAEFLPHRKDYWRGHYDRICKLMRERLWSEELGIFVDYDVISNTPSSIMSSAGFLPLYCGCATKEQAAKMVTHLTNPETFGTPLRIPSIAANNTLAYKKDMWRGPVWININYMICLGLERYGYHELARSIIRDTMREEEKWYLRHGTFFEFYDDRMENDPKDLERKGKMPAIYNPSNQVFHDYGWSATLYLELINRPEWN